MICDTAQLVRRGCLRRPKGKALWNSAMAEKVRDGIDGLHFEPGSPKAIVAVLRRLLTNHKLLPQLAQGIKPPFSVSRCAEAHLAFIGRLVCGKQTVGRTTPQETALPCENI